MSRLTSCYFLRFPVYPLHERQRNVAICVRVQVSSGAKRPSPTPLVTPAPTAQRTASAYHAPARTSENAAVQTASVRCGSSTREPPTACTVLSSTARTSSAVHSGCSVHSCAAALREVREAAAGLAGSFVFKRLPRLIHKNSRRTALWPSVCRFSLLFFLMHALRKRESLFVRFALHR